MKPETISEFETKMQSLQETMTADEYDQTISDFWNYFHLLCYYNKETGSNARFLFTSFNTTIETERLCNDRCGGFAKLYRYNAAINS